MNDSFELFFKSLNEKDLWQRQVPYVYFMKPLDIFMVHDFNQWDTLQSQLPGVKAKYQRRVSSFLRSIKEPTLFLYYVQKEEDCKWINGNLPYILDSLRKTNGLNDLLFISDENFKIDAPCFYVRNDDGSDISDSFVEQNPALQEIFNSLPYPSDIRAQNLMFFRKKKLFKPFKKIMKKLKTCYVTHTRPTYHHCLTWFD